MHKMKWSLGKLPKNRFLHSTFQSCCIFMLSAFFLFSLIRETAQAQDIEPAIANNKLFAMPFVWEKISQGLEMTNISLNSQNSTIPSNGFIILRIDPEFYEFTLNMASEEGRPFSLKDWATRKGLSAAINAGMYLPDMLTNTGYMQSQTHTNNPRIAAKFGSFFVASPYKKQPGTGAQKKDSLPKAVLIDRDDAGADLENILKNYQIVLQNYRLINSRGSILWPQGGPTKSIAALSMDSTGKIFFILCRQPLSAMEFATLLQGLDLKLNGVMYLEGGTEAGLLLKTGENYKVWRGELGLLPGNSSPDSPLPNIIGIKIRSTK